MGIMHRDVKPHNVMIDHEHRKVSDETQSLCTPTSKTIPELLNITKFNRFCCVAFCLHFGCAFFIYSVSVHLRYCVKHYYKS